ncbi:MAG: lipocalin-like domain-containing protein [Methylovirgula sp.]|uniref:lipocalin-like domain-containing protein n=1 Tax=Methylovirgula sp. TaxID=1978224 RepID=UPI0030764051
MTTLILRGRAIFLLAISMFGAGAVPAMPASLGASIIGHWQLEAVDVSGNAPYGAKPQGSMFLDATGHYSIIVISDGGARSIAYFGTYRTDDAAGTVIFHVTGASQPPAVGHDQTRLVKLNGDELVQQSLPAPGRPVLKVTWKRG